jgi:outer membrane receptor protein involved in Fe transport
VWRWQYWRVTGIPAVSFFQQMAVGMRSVWGSAGWSVLMLTCAISSGPAKAQNADVVIVTESRTGQSLSQVSASLSQIDSIEIERIRAEHISEVLARIPGVSVQRGNGQEHLTSIRSPVLTSGAGAGSFLFLENGIPLRAKGFANVNGLFEAHFELASGIEIVRGPGGVVHGSNAVHGVINVLAPEPAAQSGGMVALSAGSYGRHHADVLLNIAAENQGLAIGFTEIFEDGYRDDAGLDQQKLTLVHQFQAQNWQAKTTLAMHRLDQETAGFVKGTNAYLDPVLRRTNANPEAFRKAKAVRLSTRIEIEGNGKTILLTPYARWTDMDFLMHFLPSKALEENGHSSIGLQSAILWQAGDGGFTQIGLDMERTDGFLRETQSKPSFGSFPTGVHYDYQVIEQDISGYFQWKKPLSRRWTVDAGARVEYTGYAYDNLSTNATIGRIQRPADRDDDFTTLAAKLGVRYDFGDRSSAFIGYKRGARAPQTSDLYRLQPRQGVDEIVPETIDSIETGWRFKSGKVRFETSVYYMEKRHFFFRNADGFNVIDGETSHFGVESALELTLSDAWALAGNIAFGQHKYQFDDNVARSSEIIKTGNRIDTAPELLANMRILWTPLVQLDLEIEWAHVSPYFTDAANDHSYPGHDVFHLRGKWRFNAHAEVFFAVRNLTDTFYAERADFAFGRDRYFPAEPRTVSAGLRVRF